MWGLDATDPRTAIAAMQAMNASVRNPVFFPAFFLTPVALLVSSALLWKLNFNRSATWFGSAAITYFCFGLMLTMLINVPMNEALALRQVPEKLADAKVVWSDYSATWQFWNQIRTVASGVSFLMAVFGVLSLSATDQTQKTVR